MPPAGEFAWSGGLGADGRVWGAWWQWPIEAPRAVAMLVGGQVGISPYFFLCMGGVLPWGPLTPYTRASLQVPGHCGLCCDCWAPGASTLPAAVLLVLGTAAPPLTNSGCGEK